MTHSPLLQVEGLTSTFPTPRGRVEAVRDVSFELGRGEIVGLVGESGSGKTATAQSIMGLLPPSAQVSGRAEFEGEDLLSASAQRMRSLRGNKVSMIFQDPMTSLNPVLTVGTQIRDVLRAHGRATKLEARVRGEELLRRVGIPEPALRLRQYAHQMSGGMRQRVMIALALANEPTLLIADEPTTALDATVQAEILELLVSLRDDLGMSILLVTHDLGVVARVCDRMIVMYGGKIVESGPVEQIFARAEHPYSRALMQSTVPVNISRSQRLVAINGAPPAMIDPPGGCAFADRCPSMIDSCRTSEISLTRRGQQHLAACLVTSNGADHE